MSAEEKHDRVAELILDAWQDVLYYVAERERQMVEAGVPTVGCVHLRTLVAMANQRMVDECYAPSLGPDVMEEIRQVCRFRAARVHLIPRRQRGEA